MEQRYPFSVNIYLNKERYFINPDLANVWGSRESSPWIKIISKDASAHELGQAVLEALEYIKASPIFNGKAYFEKYGSYRFWTREDEKMTISAFNKKNLKAYVNLSESGVYSIFSPKRLGSMGWNGCIKEHENSDRLSQYI